MTGSAVTESPSYRFTWLIEFASRAVIDFYRDHPLHKQFADNLFRPIAGDRVSVPAGATMPADGVIATGDTAVDESLLTGESRPLARGVGDAVVAGSLNLRQPIEMTVTRGAAESRLAELPPAHPVAPGLELAVFGEPVRLEAGQGRARWTAATPDAPARITAMGAGAVWVR